MGVWGVQLQHLLGADAICTLFGCVCVCVEAPIHVDTAELHGLCSLPMRTFLAILFICLLAFMPPPHTHTRTDTRTHAPDAKLAPVPSRFRFPPVPLFSALVLTTSDLSFRAILINATMP